MERNSNDKGRDREGDQDHLKGNLTKNCEPKKGRFPVA